MINKRLYLFLSFVLFVISKTFSQKSIEQNLTVNSPCSTLGVDEKSTNWNFYPNPSNETVELYFSNLPVQIQLIDLEGRIIFEEKIVKEKTILYSHTFPKGVYFLSVEKNGIVEQRKLTFQ